MKLSSCCSRKNRAHSRREWPARSRSTTAPAWRAPPAACRSCPSRPAPARPAASTPAGTPPSSVPVVASGPVAVPARPSPRSRAPAASWQCAWHGAAGTARAWSRCSSRSGRAWTTAFVTHRRRAAPRHDGRCRGARRAVSRWCRRASARRSAACGSSLGGPRRSSCSAFTVMVAHAHLESAVLPTDGARSAASGSVDRTPCTSVSAGPRDSGPAAPLVFRTSGLVVRSPLRHAGHEVNPDPSREPARARDRRSCDRGGRADRARCAGVEASPPSRSLVVPAPNTAARSTAARGHATGTRRSRADTPSTRTHPCAPPAPRPQPVTPKFWSRPRLATRSPRC